MPRYGDLDSLKSEFEWLLSQVSESSKDEIRDVIKRIDNAPTADVEPVVHCKDCEYWKPSGAKAGNLFEKMEPLGSCMYAKFFRQASEFCSRGERRTDG